MIFPGKSITSSVKNILDKPVKRFHGFVLYFEWSFHTVCIESRHLAKTINIVYANLVEGFPGLLAEHLRHSTSELKMIIIISY